MPVKPPTPQQIVSPQGSQPAGSPKGRKTTVLPPGGSLGHQPPLPSKPGALS
jgi:hypothetical protein